MRVRGDDKTRAGVEEIAHCLLLASRFAMKIDDDGVRARVKHASGKFTLDGGKGIVERIHENTPHGVDHECALAVLRIDQCSTAAGRTFWIVDGANQTWCPLDKHKRLALIPGVVAERDGIRACIDQLIVDDFSNAKATGSILSVDHDQFELPLGD